MTIIRRIGRRAKTVARATLLGLVLLFLFALPALANGITLYVEIVPDNPSLKAAVEKHLHNKAEAQHPGQGFVRFADQRDDRAKVLRVEKLSAHMSESNRRSTVFTLHDNEVDADKRGTFPAGSKVELDMVVSDLTVSYVYRLQMVVNGKVWDAATLEMPPQTLDYRYGEHLRVVGPDGQVTTPAKGDYPNQKVAQFVRHGDRNYVDQMYADGMGKAVAHLVAKFFGPINTALRNAPFEDFGTRDGILFAERYRKIAQLTGQVTPLANACGMSERITRIRAKSMKLAEGFRRGKLPFGLGLSEEFIQELRDIMVSAEKQTLSEGVLRDGCTDQVAVLGTDLFNKSADETNKLVGSFYWLE